MNHILTVSLIICIGCKSIDARPRQNEKDSCSFGDLGYSSGESWHPYLQPIGYLYCITCTCREGLVNCMNIKCPALSCPNPVSVPGQCCKQCSEDLGRVSLSETHGSSCHYADKDYYHGELFSIEGVFNSHRDDQCVQCSCSDSRVFCALRNCPVVNCPQSVILPDSCCPVCPDKTDRWEYDYYDTDYSEGATNQQKAREHLFSDVLKGEVILSGPIKGIGAEDAEEEEDQIEDMTSWKEPEETSDGRECLSNGQIYEHGKSWNPYLFPFGKMNCIICTCRNTKTKCERLTCPEDHELACDNPVNILGQCCKSCPGDSDGAVMVTEDDTCLLDRETLLIYEYRRNSAENMEHTGIQQYAIDNLKEKITELHKWQIEGGEMRNFEILKLSVEDFVQLREQDTQGRFELTGASTEHRLKKLKKKEKQLYDNCSEDCHREITKLLRTLKPREIEKRVNLCQNQRTLKEDEKNNSSPERHRGQ
ncbi:neuralin precursor [Saccoglossus kowalevskii]|uniref:Neuralin precursor n=1 Tax=Saccoglossus kowalevskii TaxID=10224 RepID=B5M233_SACKO|nr:neuralin precursor [Saccoglossus kowalevskii]ACH68445.1 neuralin protein [Saccoglossus kowalevskii]